MRLVQTVVIFGLIGTVSGQKSGSYDRLYVFGDSYSDIGEGYLDGNGPTAVAYLARNLGFELVRSDKSTSSAQSLDFAVSGAQTGSSAGTRTGASLLGFGMVDQVADFASRLKSGKLHFDPKETLFFIAGGLNDRKLPTEATVRNLKGEIRTLYELGGRRFQVALLPTAIPAFSEVGLRLNPAIALIPGQLKSELRDARIELSHWGPFFDEVIRHPAEYGIRDTTDACAGREIFHENATACATPDTYFYYHAGHPSTAVHKIVGAKLAQEIR